MQNMFKGMKKFTYIYFWIIYVHLCKYFAS